ncbi:MAG: hypothetical protein COB35_13150 [Gammaproteobacteria bacterium]|nr:MAG: hypothetical protein COB35_13150 [Gammaproteobacteria bacterium]
MMKLLKMTKTALVVMALSTLTVTAQANTAAHVGKHEFSQAHQGMPTAKMHKNMMHKRFKRMAHALGLSKEQRSQVKDIFKNAREQKVAFKPTMAAFHQAMKELLTASSFDEQAILTLKTSYKPTFDQLAMIKAKSRYDMYALLTQEQKDKWNTMHEQRMEHAPMGE